MAETILNCFSKAEIDCCVYIAEATGHTFGRTAFIGPQLPYPSCMSFEFTGSNSNDTSFLSSHSMPTFPMSARVYVSALTREAVWDFVARVVNALPRRDLTENVELLRISSVGLITAEEQQFQGEPRPRVVWTCQIDSQAVVITGGKTEETAEE